MNGRSKHRRDNLSTDFKNFTFGYEQITNNKTGQIRATKIWVVDNFTARTHSLGRPSLNQLLAQLNACLSSAAECKDTAVFFQPADHVNLEVLPSEARQLMDLADFCLRLLRA